MPKGKRFGRRGRPASGAQGVIVGINSLRAQLLADRDALDQQIAGLDAALRAMGGAPTAGRMAGGRGRRGPRRGSLKEYILKVMSSRGIMAVKDVADGVRSAGYKTKNKTLAKSVGIALTQLPNVDKIGRGQFRLK